MNKSSSILQIVLYTPETSSVLPTIQMSFSDTTSRTISRFFPNQCQSTLYVCTVTSQTHKHTHTHITHTFGVSTTNYTGTSYRHCLSLPSAGYRILNRSCNKTLLTVLGSGLSGIYCKSVIMKYPTYRYFQHLEESNYLAEERMPVLLQMKVLSCV